MYNTGNTGTGNSGTGSSAGASSYATGASALAGIGGSAGYGGRLGAMRSPITPREMGLQPVDLKGYIPERPQTMYDPRACRQEMTKLMYRPEQTSQAQQTAIRTPIGVYPSDFAVSGFNIRNTRPFKSEFKPNYN